MRVRNHQEVKKIAVIFCFLFCLFSLGAPVTKKETIQIDERYRVVRVTPANPSDAKRIRLMRHVPNDPNGHHWHEVKVWYQGEWPEFFTMNQLFRKAQ